MTRSNRRQVRQLLLAVVLMMGCGGSPNWDLFVYQVPTSNLPEAGQAVYDIPGRNINLPTGYVTGADLVKDTIVISNVGYSGIYRLEVDSTESFYVGEKLTWAGGEGKVLKATRTQMYGAVGEVGVP